MICRSPPPGDNGRVGLGKIPRSQKKACGVAEPSPRQPPVCDGTACDARRSFSVAGAHKKNHKDCAAIGTSQHPSRARTRRDGGASDVVSVQRLVQDLHGTRIARVNSAAGANPLQPRGFRKLHVKLALHAVGHTWSMRYSAATPAVGAVLVASESSTTSAVATNRRRHSQGTSPRSQQWDRHCRMALVRTVRKRR